MHAEHDVDPPMRTSSEHAPARVRNLWLAAAAAIAIVVFYFLREHWGHTLGLFPYALLALCPLLHLFGHRHGGHR